MKLPSTKKRQRRFNSKNEDEKRLDFVTNKFSKELVLSVFGFLSLQDLIQCTAVSAEWSSMANDEMLWKPLFFRRFRDPIIRENQKSKFQHNNRRVSVSRYGGSWKMKYRIHHNWLLGQCYINDIKNVFKHNSVNHQLQFLNDIVFAAQSDSSVIDVWRYIENDSTLLFQIPIVEENNVNVTFLKLENTTKHLVAGYSNGGFTVWKVEGTTSLDVNIIEIVSYTPRTTHGNVTCIGINYPMILVCTDKMKLSIFYVDDFYSLQLVHRLQSPIDWSHINIDIQRYHPQKIRESTELWKATLCFGISGESSNSSIGIQELILSSNSIKSSRHGFALDCEPIFSSLENNSSYQITAMAYSPPYLITAHANNTMKQYIVDIDETNFNISFNQTLYGHTFQVDALAIDATKKKLISGDRSGIKIWDLSKQGEGQVIINNHSDQHKMNELPLFHFESIDFDEDKIIAIVNLTKESFIRLWSFNSMK